MLTTIYVVIDVLLFFPVCVYLAPRNSMGLGSESTYAILRCLELQRAESRLWLWVDSWVERLWMGVYYVDRNRGFGYLTI